MVRVLCARLYKRAKGCAQREANAAYKQLRWRCSIHRWEGFEHKCNDRTNCGQQKQHVQQPAFNVQLYERRRLRK